MKSKFKTKFLFTQISGPLVGALLSLFLLFGMKKLWPEFIIGSYSKFFNATVVVLLILTVLIVTLTLWGKLLVYFKILTEEEADGYPWSKPWLDKKF